MSDDQLRAKSLAVFHALVSTWSNDLRKEVSGLQDELLKRLDALQDQMSNYDENIDEERILTFVREVSNLAGGGGGGGVVFYIESRRFLIRDSPRPATTYEQKTGGADGVKGA